MQRIERGVGVWFTNLELWALWQMAQKRQAAKDKRYAKDKRSDKKLDNVEMHYIGLKAEYAFQKVFDKSVDYRPMSNGDLLGDFTWKGHSIEVKNLQGYLVFNDRKHFGAEIGVLVSPFKTGTSFREVMPDPYVKSKKAHCYHDVVLVGWCWRDEFFETCFEKDFGYGKRLCKKPETLLDIYELFRVREGVSV